MNIFLEVLKIILKFLLPVLLVLLVLTIINIVINYKKYGTKIFSSFKKYNLNGKMKDLVIEMLKKENHKETLIVERDDISFYAITNYGIFAIMLLDYSGPLYGSIADEFLMYNDKQILNPIPSFSRHNKLIENKKINFKTIYINTKKDTKIKINGLPIVHTLKDFCYKLYQNQHSDKKYSKEEMLELQKEIEDIINGDY